MGCDGGTEEGTKMSIRSDMLICSLLCHRASSHECDFSTNLGARQLQTFIFQTRSKFDGSISFVVILNYSNSSTCRRLRLPQRPIQAILD